MSEASNHLAGKSPYRSSDLAFCRGPERITRDFGQSRDIVTYR